eukprot:11165688-Alexandrium_andersonii.AAC.1
MVLLDFQELYAVPSCSTYNCSALQHAILPFCSSLMCQCGWHAQIATYVSGALHATTDADAGGTADAYALRCRWRCKYSTQTRRCARQSK